MIAREAGKEVRGMTDIEERATGDWSRGEREEWIPISDTL